MYRTYQPILFKKLESGLIDIERYHILMLKLHQWDTTERELNSDGNESEERDSQGRCREISTLQTTGEISC
jgi:hypothetical protein